MSYVRRVLQPGEVIVHETRLHPIIFLSAAVWFIAALVLLIWALNANGDWRIAGEVLAGFCAVFGLASGIPALIRRVSTDLAVTDRRVIYKSGLYFRATRWK
jgi:hypothetical protein